MQRCLLCQRAIRKRLTLPWILSWQPVPRPVVCQACWAQFTVIDRATACMGCGRTQTHKQLCQDCQRWPGSGTFHNIALFTYNDAMHRYFQQYKFQGDYQLRRVFAATMQQAVASYDVDRVLSVPVTPTTMQTRGFNQVTGWLAVGENQPELFTKAKSKGIPQSKKDRQARLQTPQPFELAAGIELAGQRVLLVDDIYTTGRTIRHAATLLLENGAKTVTGLTLAR